MTTLPPVTSQIGYPGAGDVDDCWVVASDWGATAADANANHPTVPEFRAAAHNPDRPGPTPGDLDDVIRGSTQTWPYLTIERHDSAIWSDFADRLREGWSASLAVMSAALPARLQFGFRGPHQVGAAWRAGEFRLANPLAHTGSAPAFIEESELRTAARAVAGGAILAALFEPYMEASMVVVTDPSPRFVALPAGRQVFATDGKTRLTKIVAATTDTYSPAGGPTAIQRYIVVTTGGVRQLAVVNSVGLSFRPYPNPADVKHTVTLQVEGQADYTTSV